MVTRLVLENLQAPHLELSESLGPLWERIWEPIAVPHIVFNPKTAAIAEAERICVICLPAIRRLFMDRVGASDTQKSCVDRQRVSRLEICYWAVGVQDYVGKVSWRSHPRVVFVGDHSYCAQPAPRWETGVQSLERVGFPYTPQ